MPPPASSNSVRGATHQARVELCGTLAFEHEVSVWVYQAGHEHQSVRVDDVQVGVASSKRRLDNLPPADSGDAAISDERCTIRDQPDVGQCRPPFGDPRAGKGQKLTSTRHKGAAHALITFWLSQLTLLGQRCALLHGRLGVESSSTACAYDDPVNLCSRHDITWPIASKDCNARGTPSVRAFGLSSRAAPVDTCASTKSAATASFDAALSKAPVHRKRLDMRFTNGLGESAR
jgi:hypothetical protein